MRNKLLSLYFLIYLLISGSSIILTQDMLYNLQTSSKAVEKKLCLVVIDGLRYDAVGYMPFLSNSAKSKDSILYKAHCSLPSNSRPGYERIFTGSETTINGIDSNYYHLPSLTPNVFSIAGKNGLKTGLSGFYWIYELYPADIDYSSIYYKRFNSVFTDALRVLHSHKPDFMVVHPMELDAAGHKYGGNSKEYINFSTQLDTEIKGLWSEISSMGYTMIVTSDHGHRDSGGHGGSNIKCIEIPIEIFSSNMDIHAFTSAAKARDQLDIAPTICDILGIPKTIYMTGDSLLAAGQNISCIQNIFAFPGIKNFKHFFFIASQITCMILSLFTVIHFACMIIIIGLIKKIG